MDYSLLVGVHYLDRAKAKSPEDTKSNGASNGFNPHPKGRDTAHLVVDHSDHHRHYEPALNAVQEDVHKTESDNDGTNTIKTPNTMNTLNAQISISVPTTSNKELTPFDGDNEHHHNDYAHTVPLCGDAVHSVHSENESHGIHEIDGNASSNLTVGDSVNSENQIGIGTTSDIELEIDGVVETVKPTTIGIAPSESMTEQTGDEADEWDGDHDAQGAPPMTHLKAVRSHSADIGVGPSGLTVQCDEEENDELPLDDDEDDGHHSVGRRSSAPMIVTPTGSHDENERKKKVFGGSVDVISKYKKQSGSLHGQSDSMQFSKR